MSVNELLNVLDADGLQIGLIVGSVFALLVVVIARGTGTQRSAIPVAGLLAAAGGAYAIARSSSLPADVAVGLFLLAVGGWAARWWFARFPLVVAGGAVLAGAAPDHPSWIPVIVFLTAVVGGTAAADFDRRVAASGLGPVLFAVTALGVYVTVPETDGALALVGVSVPLAFTGWPRALARLGSGGAYASVGLLAWVAATGGVFRPSSVVGAVACLGLFLVVPAVVMVLGPFPDRTPPFVPTVVLHGGVVVLVARVAGLRSSAELALAIAVVVLLIAALVVAWWMRRTAGSP